MVINGKWQQVTGLHLCKINIKVLPKTRIDLIKGGNLDKIDANEKVEFLNYDVYVWQ